jgi:long-subunit acyl-CoA synthetase (AMP-forming)/acyl carrier protein
MEDLKTADLSTLSEEEMDALLEFAFERYFETSGLFGTVEQCVEIANKVRALGVDEIACLIDFGVPTDLALSSLKLLNKVREQCQATIGQADLSLPAQMDRHSVTHLQCTPSMAKMLVVSEDSRAALRKLKKLMVGGEALPGGLAADLARLVPNGTHNMYGPTETTIWSTTAPVTEGPVTIGRPIANTSIYLLNQAMEPVPIGSVGDLYIGGEGVAQGYWERPELNAERFLANPFRSNERIYRTGDLARYNWDGSIEFLGRSDTQVKIRGFRIELGEIEAIANTYPGVRTSVVTARAVDDAEPLLVCYWIPDPTQPSAPKAQEMREWIRQRLPEYMTPAVFVEMAEFPLTHNGKIDRKELPAPQTAETVTAEVAEASRPAGELETLIAGIWQQSLNRSAIGVEDNFFDLGGHSILAVQVSTKLGEALDKKISLMEMFRFPTIRSLAKRLSGGETEVNSDAAQSRAKLRLEMQANRGQLRRGTRRSA